MTKEEAIKIILKMLKMTDNPGTRDIWGDKIVIDRNLLRVALEKK